MKKYCLFLKYVSHFLQLQEEKCEMIQTASMHQCNVLSLQYCFNYTHKTKDIKFCSLLEEEDNPQDYQSPSFWMLFIILNGPLQPTRHRD